MKQTAPDAAVANANRRLRVASAVGIASVFRFRRSARQNSRGRRAVALFALRLLFLPAVLLFTASFAPIRAAERQHLEVVFFGDSVALGQGASAPERGFSSILLQRLDDSGLQTEHRLLVSAFGGLYVDLVKAREAVNEASGLIVVEVGAHSVIENPALPLSAYRRAYGLMLDCLQSSGAAVVVGTVPSLNWTPNDPLYIRAGEISEAVRDEARSRGIAVADLWAATRDRPDLASEDGMHPGDAGHQLIGDLFWRQIEPLLPRLRQGSATSCGYSNDETRQLLR